jgi:hypothetical protein
MRKQPISVSLEADNLVWLRGRALAAGRRSVSEMLDRLVHAARAGGAGHATGARSVVGSVRISAEDPELRSADAALRALFSRLLERRSARARVRRARRRGGRGE